MLPGLSGKVAIITASSTGIGFAIAERLATKENVKVVISSRNLENVTQAVARIRSQGGEAEGCVCHVAKGGDREKLIKTAIDKWGRIDIFVANAAISPHFGPTLQTSESAWDKTFEVNLKATFLLTKDIVPYMAKGGGGAIVYVSSIGGYKVLPGIGVYNLSKTAMIAMAKLLSTELAADKIRVNAIAPGVIKTRFAEALWKPDDAAEVALAQVPMGRLGVPEDCAGVVAFLCSDDASYVTGECVVIAGGNPASRL